MLFSLPFPLANQKRLTRTRYAVRLKNTEKETPLIKIDPIYTYLFSVQRIDMQVGCVDDTYAINVAKTEYREGFNTGDADRVVAVFAPEFTDNSDGRPSRYGKDAPAKLRQHLKGLFAEYQANLNLVTVAIVISGNFAFEYGCQELTLTPKNGGEARFIRKRFLELWAKQTDGQWRIIRYIDNRDLPDVVD